PPDRGAYGAPALAAGGPRRQGAAAPLHRAHLRHLAGDPPAAQRLPPEAALRRGGLCGVLRRGLADGAGGLRQRPPPPRAGCRGRATPRLLPRASWGLPPGRAAYQEDRLPARRLLGVTRGAYPRGGAPLRSAPPAGVAPQRRGAIGCGGSR